MSRGRKAPRSQSEAAKAMGVSVRCFQSWIANGAPNRNARGEYDLDAIRAWRSQRAEELAAKKAQPSKWSDRKERAAALLAELKLEQARGDVIPRADVARLFVERCVVFRRGLERIARKAAPRLVALSSPAEALAILEAEHRQLLEDYSRDHPVLRGQQLRRGKGARPDRPRLQHGSEVPPADHRIEAGPATSGEPAS